MGTAEDGPRPGDPRSSGPRPRATGKDIGWGALAVVVSAITAAQFVRLTLALLQLERHPGAGALLLGFLVTVAWLMTIWWLVMGAWRRTVWGCPFDHRADSVDARRCPRHAQVSTPAVDENHPGTDPMA